MPRILVYTDLEALVFRDEAPESPPIAVSDTVETSAPSLSRLPLLWKRRPLFDPQIRRFDHLQLSSGEERVT